MNQRHVADNEPAEVSGGSDARVHTTGSHVNIEWQHANDLRAAQRDGMFSEEDILDFVDDLDRVVATCSANLALVMGPTLFTALEECIEHKM